LPYRWYLQRLKLGFALDVGCGIGRNLANLDGNAVGVDHNPESVRIARDRGFSAFTAEEFRASDFGRPGTFDSLLCSHVVEHMTQEQARALLREYTPFVRAGGRVVVVTPQEAGFRSDATHVEFVDFGTLDRLVRSVGLTPEAAYSRPFPRLVGRFFRYNEFISLSRRPE
jgi:2-polyprenyl-3-methyl-5-hydroxy-6-metoxy-1,4-benzoquinol methylase